MESSPVLTDYLSGTINKVLDQKWEETLDRFHIRKIKQYENEEEYESPNVPFVSFRKVDPEEDEEQVYEDFKAWLIQQQELFLMTFEGPFSKDVPSPFFHTFLSSSKQDENDFKKENEREKQETLDSFIKQRLKLIHHLIKMYKKVKKLMNKKHKTYSRDSSEREDFKIVASTMVKQMALEYLYIWILKCKAQIDNLQSSGNDLHCEELNEICKYVSEMAEKLRCAIEYECEHTDDPEGGNMFNRNIVRSLAKMYLNEIEQLITRKKAKSTSSRITGDEEGILEECRSEEKVVRELFGEKSDSMDESSISEIGEDRGLFRYANDLELDGEIYETLIDMRHVMIKESFKPLEFLASLKRKVLTRNKVDASQLQHIEKVQAFKRELWMINCFHFYTHNVNPSLGGRYLLRLKVNEGSSDSMGHAKTISTDDERYSQKSASTIICCCDIKVGSVSGPDFDRAGLVETNMKSGLVMESNDSELSSMNRFAEIFKFFVSYIQNEKEITEGEPDEEIWINEEGEIDEIEWINLDQVCWDVPQRKMPNKPIVLECGQEKIDIMKEEVHSANIQYMSDHPELLAIVVLLLREFFLECPDISIPIFARNCVSSKSFAKRLFKFLLHSNKDFRMKHHRRRPQCCHDVRLEGGCRTYEFDMSQTEYWEFWGVKCTLADDFKIRKRRLKRRKGRSSYRSWKETVRQEVYKQEAALNKEVDAVASIFDKWIEPTGRKSCH